MELQEWKDLIALTASISTVLQFLSGIMVCQKFVQKGTTGDTSCFPFICGFLSCSLWLRYGFLIQEKSMIFVNTIGSTLFLAYCITFLYYSIKKSGVIRQLFGVSLILSIILFYTVYEQNHELALFRMGLVCCTVTVLFFAAPLASLLYVMRTKSTEILPFPLIVASFIVSFQWWIYGIILEDAFIQIPNFLGFTLSGLQLTLFLCYPSVSAKNLGYNLVINHQL